MPSVCLSVHPSLNSSQTADRNEMKNGRHIVPTHVTVCGEKKFPNFKNCNLNDFSKSEGQFKATGTTRKVARKKWIVSKNGQSRVFLNENSPFSQKMINEIYQNFTNLGGLDFEGP